MKRVVPETGVRGTGRITEDDTPEAQPRCVASVEAWRSAFPAPTTAELVEHLCGREDLPEILQALGVVSLSRICPACGRLVRLRRDGRLRAHGPRGKASCPMSGGLPSEALTAG